MNDYADKELAKLERQQQELRDRQDSRDKDRYNALEGVKFNEILFE